MRKDYVKIFICFFIFSIALFLVMNISYVPMAKPLKSSSKLNDTKEGNISIMATGYIKSVQASYCLDKSEEYIRDILKNSDLLIGSTDISFYKLTNIDKKLVKKIDYDVTKNDFAKHYILKKVKGQTIGISYITCVPEEHGNIKGEQMKEIQETIKSIKNSGAEIIIFYINWNEGNTIDFGNYKKNLGEFLNKNGVHIVIGCDGKGVKPIEKIIDDKTGHVTYMAYSIGNLVEGPICKGIILKFDITKDSSGVAVANVSYMPILSKVSEDNLLKLYPAVNADKDYLTQEDIKDITECYSYIKSMAEKRYKTIKIIEQ